MKVRVGITNGTFDLNMPADFNFGAWVQAVRGAGFIMTGDIYIPAGSIVFMAVLDETLQSPAPGGLQ